MPQFMYKAQNTSGNMMKGVMEAASEAFVLQSLKEKGYYPIEIKAAKPSREIKLDMFSKVDLRSISVFCRQFATIVSAGLTVVNGLDILRQQTENKKLRHILDQVFEEVQKGRTLSETMREHEEFPSLFVNMVEAGEASGRLEEVMERMAVYYEKEYKLRQKIRSALMYPAVISVVAVCVVVLMVTKVLPMFVDMFTGFGVELPLPTRILLGSTDFLGKYWYIVVGILVLIGYIIARYVKTKEGRYKYHSLLFKLPVIGNINKKIVTSRFSRTLSILLNSGIPVIQAMDIVERTVSNALVEQGIIRCKEDIKKGGGLSGPISSIKVFPRMLVEMISIGEDTGTLDAMLEKTSIFYDDEVDMVVSGLTTLIEPVVILLLAGVVGFIVISIVMPMFEMYQYVG